VKADNCERSLCTAINNQHACTWSPLSPTYQNDLFLAPTQAGVVVTWWHILAAISIWIRGYQNLTSYRIRNFTKLSW